MTQSDDDRLAERCAESLWATDAASQNLGMQIESVGPGRATLTMTVREMMVNGHGMCHGGYVFMLADSTFAFACNSHNERTVAMHCAITFVASAGIGDKLVAEAREQTRFGRNGIYDITVRTGDGTSIAEFRGHSRTIGGTVLPEDAAC